MSETSFIVIGLDDNRQQYFPPHVAQLIQSGKVFSGGIRHREIVGSFLPEGAEWINITVPLDNVFAHYEGHRQIVVFASGDPLFFGFANTLKKRLPKARIEVYPAFNSLQTLAHRLVMPYDDMRIVSLTGRPWHEFDRALIERSPKTGVLTDREHTPATIAQRMLEYGYTHYIMYVGEHLGNREKERVRRFTLEEAARSTFEHPNCLLLIRTPGAASVVYPSQYVLSAPPQYILSSPSDYILSDLPPAPGIPDGQFDHLDGRPRMITKAPIRLLTLSALRLNRRASFWDVGFCTGSVSIEARLQFPHIHVTSFEIRPEGRQLIETNSRRFGAPGITVFIGDFMQANLDNYPRPDAVFIGGHGGQLKEIISRLRQVLLPGGVIVFNSVSPASKALFLEGAREAGLSVKPGTRVAVDDYNPIEILTAELPFA